jgi:hypothetical protein
MTSVPRSLVLQIGLAFHHVAAAQEPPAPAAPSKVFDLRLDARVDRPLLCDLVRRLDVAELTVVDEGKETKQPVRIVEEWRFIDVLRVISKDREETSRRFLKAFKTDDGEIRDPEFNGIELHYKREGEQLRIDLADRRAINRKAVDRFLAQSSSVGWYVELPAEARVGEEVEVAIVRFIRALIDADGDLECAPARMKLVAVDDATNLARLEGAVDFSDPFEKAPVGRIFLRYHANAKVVVDLAARRIASIAVSGTARFEGNEKIELRGDGPFQATLDIREGAAAEKAAQEKPRYRPVRRKPVGSGVSFSLPSYWFEGVVENGETPYIRGMDFVDGGARIAVLPRPGKLVAKDFIAGMLASNPGAEVKPATGPLGSTVAFTIRKDVGTIVGDAHSVGDDRWMVFRLILPPTVTAEEPTIEFQAARKMLKRLPKE